MITAVLKGCSQSLAGAAFTAWKGGRGDFPQTQQTFDLCQETKPRPARSAIWKDSSETEQPSSSAERRC